MLRTRTALVVLATAVVVGCPEVGPIASQEADQYCDKGMKFEYVDNGSVSDLDDPKTIEVGRFSEFVIYLESEDAQCNGGNYNAWVDLLFKMDESSPWGGTGQGFNFSSTGGRFRSDGKYVKLVANCDVPFSFEYTMAGVSCAD